MKLLKTYKITLFLLFVLGISINISKAQEVLFFDMYKHITQSHKGFPKGNVAPEENNCDWIIPTNYTTGKVYVRVEGITAPTDVCVRSSFAIWQIGEAVVPYEARPLVNITSDPEDISVGYGEFDFSDWKYIGDTTKWDSCRIKMGPVIKSCSDKFISSNNDWNWGGEDPEDWYPMHLRYSMVVVAAGSEFSGWDNYIGTSTGIEVEAPKITMDERTAGYINAEVKPADTRIKSYIAISTNPDIVEVKDANEGRIWTHKPGTAKIIVISIDGQHKDTCVVEVVGEASSVQEKYLETNFIINNPATSNNIQLHLHALDKTNKDIRIFDLSGKRVWSRSNVREESISLDLSGIVNKGVYIVCIRDEKRVYTNKLIIN